MRPRDTESRHRKGRFHFLGCGPQSEIERCAPSFVGCCPQTATVRLDDGSADRQPHAGALRFGGKECIEDLKPILSAVRSKLGRGDGSDAQQVRDVQNVLLRPSP